MTVVVTHTELLRERHAPENPGGFESILDAAGRLSGIARKLLVFAERQQAEVPARALLAGPGLARAAGEPQPPRDSMPSILDAVEAVRDSESAVRESHSIIVGRRPPEGSLGVVLLVEDEPVLLRATRRMLEQRGYRVLPAANGPEALDYAFESSDIDVLVTDLSLPGMDGKELARRLRWLVPELAVLYMSGYDAVTSGLTLAPGAREAFLPKPFTPRDLAERLTELCGPAGREPIAQPG
jgi:CheY-like chemotaxis protein